MSRQILFTILVIIVTFTIILFCIYFLASQHELERVNYKIIIENVTNENDITNKYYFESNGSYFRIFIVTYENKDNYFLSRLYSKNGNIMIDYNYQKIINKENIETYYMDNIKKTF